jgi:X-X-X-Leu-X-X-Gly heptad repeat protein
MTSPHAWGRFLAQRRRKPPARSKTPRALPGVQRILGGAASGVARVAEGAAQLAEGAVEALASLFGGGSPAPAPKQGQEEQSTRQLDTGGRKEEFGAIQQRDDNDRTARVQEIAHSLGVSEAKTEEELKREMMEQMRRSRDRDRGGGITR